MGGVQFAGGRFPDDPQGTTLAVDLSIEDGAWRPYLGANPLQGRCLGSASFRGGWRRVHRRPLCASSSTMDAQCSPRRHGGTSHWRQSP